MAVTPHFPESDRRAFQRRPLRTTARLILTEGTVTELRTTDISEGGLGIVVSASPPIGLGFKIEVTFHIGAGVEKTVSAQVTVVNSILARDEDGFKVGLKFVAIDHEAVSNIRRFVTRS